MLSTHAVKVEYRDSADGLNEEREEESQSTPSSIGLNRHQCGVTIYIGGENKGIMYSGEGTSGYCQVSL